MDERRLRRGVYPTAKQKKKLIELVAKYPDLVSCKVRQGFNYTDAHKLWQNIAIECNAIPGARKTWRQWKKTWQDIRSKTKRRHTSDNLPASLIMLTHAEKEALGLKNVSSTTNYQTEEETEFVTLQAEAIPETTNMNEMDSIATYSDAESLPEEKVFPTTNHKVTKLKNAIKNGSKCANSCFFNCDMLSVQEQRKLQLKEEYMNFKKDYLRQKLKLMKEQTEALKDIARELSK
ncbi:hypothetical protein O3G_MSEX006703 [Manduca sexta]|uniref:Regulatory protein zeste n=1 Tax=Manduca sexta TaxID=7130 RepID=A0A921Z4D2_MANSE|nr:hypothetical protein O3G_MSEX006703 [Manduca sexta]